MNQLDLFDDSIATVPTSTVESRYALWVARQSGIYCEVLDEIEREIKGGRTPVSIRRVFETLQEQPDLASSFSAEAGFDMRFDGPMRKMIIGFDDVDAKHLEATCPG